MNSSLTAPSVALARTAELGEERDGFIPKTRPAILRITVALAACLAAAAAQTDSPAFAKFKSEMLPKVGQKITVVGTWNDEMKQCCWLAFNNWGAYIHAAGESGLAKENDLLAHPHKGQTVKVTGTLRYFSGQAATKKQVRAVQIPPEHFYIEASAVEMVPAPTNSSPH